MLLFVTCCRWFIILGKDPDHHSSVTMSVPVALIGHPVINPGAWLVQTDPTWAGTKNPDDEEKQQSESVSD